MSEDPSNNNHANLKTLLSAAVDNLKAVVDAAKETVPHIFDISVETGGLVFRRAPATETISYLMQSYLPSFQQQAVKKKRRVKQELINSIDAIKKHYRIIQKLKRGDKEKKQWAKNALDIINCYNEILIEVKHGRRSFKRKLLQLIYDASGISLIDEEICGNLIDIPSEIFLRFDSITESSDDIKIDKIASNLKQGKNVEFSKTERDIFYMRAITLAEKSKLPPRTRQRLE